MKIINISDSRSRNTRVALESRKAAVKNTFVTENSGKVSNVRAVKGTLGTSIKALTKDVSLEDLSQLLVDGDPEIDLEIFGKYIHDTNQIYLNENNEPAAGVILKEEVHLADGSVKEVRDFKPVESNINTEVPLKWSGKLMPKDKFYNKFAFAAAYQITHVDGLTYDFLYNMAKELEDKKSFLYLAAGEKSNRPLILQRDGTQYRGFLEGRTKGDKYMLVVHMTNLELKALAKQDGAE
jgi:hypothetical protein